MHRSGSSLTASILRSLGLHIGQRLIEKTEYNTKEYLENLDFYEFHKQVLQSQGLNEDGWTLQEKIDIGENFKEKAKEIMYFIEHTKFKIDMPGGKGLKIVTVIKDISLRHNMRKV